MTDHRSKMFRSGNLWCSGEKLERLRREALVQKMTFGLLETCGVLEGFFKALSFLGKGEELGIEEELEEILNKQ